MTDTPRTSQFWHQVILLILLCWTSSSASVQGPPATGLYFTLNGNIYSPGDTILITDVGDSFPDADGNTGDPSLAGPSLVCVTTNINTDCCRGRDGGNAGEWFFPDGTMVPRQSGNQGADFTRSGFTQQVRLNRRNGATSPTGVYSCRVPDVGGTEITANVLLELTSLPPSSTPTSSPASSPPSSTPISSLPSLPHTSSSPKFLPPSPSPGSSLPTSLPSASSASISTSLTSSPLTSLHPTSSLPTSSLPTSSLPTSSLPTSSLPTSSLPTSSLPTSSLPTSSLPTSPLPTSSLPTSSLSSFPSSSSLPTDNTTLLTSSFPMMTVSQTEHTDLVLWSSVGAAVLTTCVALGCVTVLCYGLCARRRKRQKSYDIGLNESYRAHSSLGFDKKDDNDDEYADVSVKAKQSSPSPEPQTGGYVEVPRLPQVAAETDLSAHQVGNVYLEGYTETLRKDTLEGYVNVPSETVVMTDDEDYATIPQFLQDTILRM